MGMAALTYGTAEAPAAGWLAPGVWLPLSVGAAALIGYGVWAARTQEPIVSLGLLRRPQALLSLCLMALVSVVTFGLIFLIPAFMQEIQGRGAVTAGLALLPQGVVTGLGTWAGLSLPTRWGLRATVATGMALLTAGTAGLFAISATSTPLMIAAILCGRGFAIGLVVQPLLTTLIDHLPQTEVPDANTLFNVAERVSGTLGIAGIITLFQQREAARITALLARAGLKRSSFRQVTSTLTTSLPREVRRELALAAARGLHDVVWWILGLSLAGLILSLAITEGKVPLQNRP